MYCSSGAREIMYGCSNQVAGWYTRIAGCVNWSDLVDPIRYCKSIYVTRFVKRSLPHTSNLPNFTVNNLRLENNIDLKFGQ